jgi:hypothetical protein
MGWLYDICSSYFLAVYSLFRRALSGILFLSSVVHHQLELGAAGAMYSMTAHGHSPEK